MYEKNCFIDITEAFHRADKEIHTRSIANAITYPITFLNDCLLGILPNELVVIGADTGLGKTEVANMTAIHNALKGKRVCIFSLEGDDHELVFRARYKYICDEYFKNPCGLELSYQKFLWNALPRELDDLVAESMSVAIPLQNNLKLFDRQQALDYATLIQQIPRLKGNFDLIVLDHLHYLSLNENEHEHTQISHIVRALKDMAKNNNIPIVLISHLRKKSKDRSLPDNEDFHGSSNIAKEADTCITISEAPNEASDAQRASYFRITKSRTGAPRQYIGKVYYDTIKKCFCDKYYLSGFVGGKLSDELTGGKIPTWAKNCGDRMFEGADADMRKYFYANN